MAARAPAAGALPAVSFPAHLPISARMDEIVALIRDHPVVIVAGETGSGKTTQLPKACIRAGLGCRGMIAHTQPRRLAARAVATRIAEELNVPLGGAVGFAVRYEEALSPSTVVKVMTDGLLLTEIRRSRRLDAYEALIIDEAHERSLNVDFLLGYAKRLLHRRRDFKLVITSATIDVAAFQAHFDDAPAIEVSGRGYPVAVEYREDDGDGQALRSCLNEIGRRRPGQARDTLIFLPGEREILDLSRQLRHDYGERFEILPLYARLPAKEQRRIFASGHRPRIVLATNVAETTITVPNIGYVIDFGLARIARYSHRARIQRLPVEAVSQASAEQRAGRCGRIAPGTCFRLYSREDFDGRPRHTEPEITRSNLAAVVLQMLAFRLGDIERFPFLDPPDARLIRDAMRTLRELGALREEPPQRGSAAPENPKAEDSKAKASPRLTEAGRNMARLPVDPRLARVLIAAAAFGCLREGLLIVAALAVQDPRERPLDKRAAADAAHRCHAHPKSDFMAFVSLWDHLEAQRAELTRGAFRKALERQFLSPARVAEWRALHRQLLLATKRMGLRLNRQAGDYASIHRALLTGSLGFVGRRDESGAYLGAHGVRFRIFPGAALGKKTPPWLVAAEVVQTRQTYARCVASVEPEWVEKAAGSLLKRSWAEPHWDAVRGEAMAFERATLYGLPVVERRLVRYAPVDAAAARELFVRGALVPATSGARNPAVEAPFLRRNAATARRIEALQAKTRRNDLLATESAQAAFYLERLPNEVLSVATFNAWLRHANAETLRRLTMEEADLLARSGERAVDADFPPTLDVGVAEARLKYRFAPGEADDGVSLQIDSATLARLRPQPLDWLVPGFFERKCAELLRRLPKPLRRRLPPVADVATELATHFLANDRYGRGALLPALCERLREMHGVDVRPADWQAERLSPFLLLNVQVRDRRGRVIDQDRNLEALQRRLLPEAARRASPALREGFERQGLVSFPQSGVPATLDVEGTVLYPALRDAGDAVDLTLLDHPADQRRVNRRGYSRLALLSQRKIVRFLSARVKAEQTLLLRYAALHAHTPLEDELLLCAAWACFFDDTSVPQDGAAFEERIAAGASRLSAVFDQALDAARAALEGRFEAAQSIAALQSPAFAASRADMEAHLERLLPEDFLSRTALDRLAELPRYLRALSDRAAKLQGHVQRDMERCAEAARWHRRVEALAAACDDAAALDGVRWMLEEYRVALFSQGRGVKGKVSPRRLEQAITPLERDAGMR